MNINIVFIIILPVVLIVLLIMIYILNKKNIKEQHNIRIRRLNIEKTKNDNDTSNKKLN